jgi:hypothetical protein
VKHIVRERELTEGLRCWYTNLDGYNNKRTELEVRLAQLQPDIIGLTEINPKNATWEMTAQDLSRVGYACFADAGKRSGIVCERLAVCM